MISRIALITVVTTAMSVGGLMADQGTSLRNRRNARAGFLDHMSTALNLTDQQKQEAKSIFMSEREAARPVRQQLMQERKSVRAAIQSGQPAAQVQQLAKNEGPTLGDLAGMRAAAFDKFYAELTPAQQQKLAGLHQQWRQHHAAGAQNGSAANR